MELSNITQKRLNNELKDLMVNKLGYAQIVQDKQNNKIFYFLLIGMDKSPYEGGYYIGQITLPNDYPVKPGEIKMLTPSGRFRICSNICLTNSSYHPESWTPVWSIRNIVIGFYSIFNSDTDGGISHIHSSETERKKLAFESFEYNVYHHRDIFVCFDDYIQENDNKIIPFVKQETKQNKSTVNTNEKEHNIYEVIKNMPIEKFNIDVFLSLEKIKIIE